jgi:TRAP-type mannitol/chloroaromatic compound transport system permease small subunit
MQAERGTVQSRGTPLLEKIQMVKQLMDRVLLWTGYLAGGLFMFLAFFITYDVLARKWGSALGVPTTRVTDEISGYLLVLAATWGFGYALRTEAHVRIDVLLPYMPRWLRAFVDFLTLLLTAFLSWIFAWKIWLLMLDSLETGIKSSTYLLTPLWLPQGILWVGFMLLALTALVLAVTSVVEPILVRRYTLSLTEQATSPMVEGLPDPPTPA